MPACHRAGRSNRFHRVPPVLWLSIMQCCLCISSSSSLCWVDNTFTLWNEAVNDSLQFQYVFHLSTLCLCNLFVPSLALLFSLFLNPNGNRSTFYVMNVNGPGISLQSSGTRPGTWGHLRWSSPIIWVSGPVCVSVQDITGAFMYHCLSCSHKCEKLQVYPYILFKFIKENFFFYTECSLKCYWSL